MPPESLPEPWRSFLAEVDSAFDSEVAFHCLGGFVITLVYGLARSTADVDVLPFNLDLLRERYEKELRPYLSKP